MFDFETPYLDMYRTQSFKFKPQPMVLHRTTCPNCGRQLVNIYKVDSSEQYICKSCLDKNKGDNR